MTSKPLKRHRSHIRASHLSIAFLSSTPNLPNTTLSRSIPTHICPHRFPIFHSSFTPFHHLRPLPYRKPIPHPNHHPQASLLPPRDSLRDVPETTLSAVEKLTRSSPRITVADVSAAAGIDLHTAQSDLVTLAALTSAPIDVTSDGDLAYRFPPHVRATLRNNSIRASARMALSRLYPFLFTAVRVSFGALLLVSLFTTLIALAALSGAASSSSSSSSSSDDDSRMYRSRGFFMPIRWYTPDLFDVIIYGRARAVTSTQPSFLEAIYSFVFGDGDPNSKLEDDRWRAVGSLIRQSGGAVTADQLAPLLEPDLDTHLASRIDSNLIDESFVLPALVKFNGEPRVTADGDIVYVFPEFMRTGAALNGNDFMGSRSTSRRGIVPALKEIPLILSKTATPQRALVLALGVLNLFAVLSLGAKLFTVVAVTPDAANFVNGLKNIYPGLLTYAASFWLVPLLRWFRLRRVNKGIEKRNAAREVAASRLAQPSMEMRKKMIAAQAFAKDAEVVTGKDVVYSSDMDAAEEQKRQREDLAKDFDRRLNGML